MSPMGMVVRCAGSVKGRVDLEPKRSVVCVFVIAVIVPIRVLVCTASIVAASPLVIFVITRVVWPNVVAFELRGLIPNGQGARQLVGLMIGRVRVVVMTVVIEIGECDVAAACVGVAAHKRTRVVGLILRSALAGVSVGEVQVRHSGCLVRLS
jgi:hypothetical protein